MTKKLLFSLVFICVGGVAFAQQVHRSKIGTETQSPNGEVKLTLIHKLQHLYAGDKDTYEPDITSPKSINIHPSGKKFYVNSLEGFCTVAFEMDTWKKLAVIHHDFNKSHTDLWAKPSGLFPFKHYTADKRDLNTFQGKPVESTFSHGGRYLWVPYYRRSYDINAQDPSAMAVIDTRTDTIVRLFETGPLPKMVACSHDSKHIAVSHWGDNTVGILNIDSNDPKDWRYEKMHVIDYQLKLNYSLSTPVNRDVNSGYTLRGTVFTPDDHYLLVGCMGGGGGIAVIDMEKQEYLGRVLGMRANIRHLIIKDGWLYLSSNSSGIVQRMRLDDFLSVLPNMKNRTAMSRGWEECSVMAGARTIEASPSGRFIFAACNNASHLCVVDTRQMKMITNTIADSFPVGLDISKDGSIVIVTSQARPKIGGGNSVNIFRVEYAEPEVAPAEEQAMQEVFEEETDTIASNESEEPQATETTKEENSIPWLWIGGGIVALLAIVILIARKRK